METPKHYLTKILLNYLKKENYHIDKHDFKLQLLSNPSYPSLKSITDSLDYFKIENVAAVVPTDALKQLPNFFLALIKNENNNSLAQVEQKKEKIKLFLDDGTTKSMTTDEFKEQWDGTVVVIDKQTEAAVTTNPMKLTPLVIVVMMVFLTLVVSVASFEIYSFLLSITSIVGVVLSYFLVREDLGLYNKETAKICNSVVQNTSCSDVVKSTSSKILGLFSLTDATIVFFSSQFLILTIVGFDMSAFKIVAVSSIPVIGYSLYTQGVSLKKWCPLCLGVAITLVAQLGIVLLVQSEFLVNPNYVVTSAITIMFVGLLWAFVKRLLKKEIELEETKTDFFSFKRDEKLFAHLISQKTLTVAPNLNSEYALVFGNLDAPLTITAVTNPTCGFCTNSFKVYDKLMQTHAGHFKMNIVFNVPANTFEYESTQIAQRIVELYSVDKDNAYSGLKEWFANKDVQFWHERYGSYTESSDLTTLQQHFNWCDANSIIYTPATIVDVNFFPKNYKIEDLPLFIEYLLERVNKKEPAVLQVQ